jgi:hypothetical protein
LWLQCVCTALVALGADHTTAAIWPLIVDGLLTMATVELWKTGHGAGGCRATSASTVRKRKVPSAASSSAWMTSDGLGRHQDYF